MKVSWLKLIWWVVIISIVVLVVRAHWFQHPDVETPEPVETAAPVITVPVDEPPRIEIKPQTIRKPIRKSAIHPNCSWVPSIAYSYPLDQVLSVARARGTSAARLRELSACWEKHHG